MSYRASNEIAGRCIPILVVMLLMLSFAATGMAQTLLPLDGVQKVSPGGSHTCALTDSGGVKCWGDNRYGQLGTGDTTSSLTPVDVANLSTGVVDLASGTSHTCALTEGGAVKCWGGNVSGQLGIGNTSNQTLPVTVPGLESSVTAIAAGDAYTCAVLADGTAQCWGANPGGQLGNGGTATQSSPVAVSGLSDAVAIAAGYSHTCARLSNGGVRCWGWNSYGQLGTGNTINQLVPADVPSLGNVIAIGAGYGFTCALLQGGTVKCWGDHGSGQVGVGNTGEYRYTSPVDVPGLTGVASLGVGFFDVCAALSDGHARCWGSNDSGESGNGGSQVLFSPVEVTGLTTVIGIEVGFRHSCAVVAGGGVKCWGENGFGQVGNGEPGFHATPQDVVGLAGGAVQVVAGEMIGCALSNAGAMRCWGSNYDGQLGTGDGLDHTAPAEIISAGVVTMGKTTGPQNCAIVSGGGLKCWGRQSFGGTITPTEVPGLGGPAQAVVSGWESRYVLMQSGGVKQINPYQAPADVPGLTSGVTDIGAGEYFACALTDAGGVKCWGDGYHGELGDGTGQSSTTPVDVVGLDSGVESLAVGGYSSCALLETGGVKCWGSGPLGDGTSAYSLVPVQVIGLPENVTSLTGGDSHNCALTASGAAWCWGTNQFGYLGDGSTSPRLTPVPVSGLSSGVVEISGGVHSTCARLDDGTVKCWGSGKHGQLGIGGRNYALPGDVMHDPNLPGAEARLAALMPDTGSLSPAFAPDTKVYVLTVAADELTLAPSTIDDGAVVSINGAPLSDGTATVALQPGVNPVDIHVSAENGLASFNYHIDAVRYSSDPVALALTIGPVDGNALLARAADLGWYRITVFNYGQQAASGVQLEAPVPGGLDNVQWNCDAPTGCMPSTGTDAVAVQFDLASGAAAHVDLSGEILPGAAFVDITAHASTASGGGMQADGQTSDPANGIGVFKNGFE